MGLAAVLSGCLFSYGKTDESTWLSFLFSPPPQSLAVSCQIESTCFLMEAGFLMAEGALCLVK